MPSLTFSGKAWLQMFVVLATLLLSTRSLVPVAPEVGPAVVNRK